jgi:hypothetical protein
VAYDMIKQYENAYADINDAQNLSYSPENSA